MGIRPLPRMRTNNCIQSLQQGLQLEKKKPFVELKRQSIDCLTYGNSRDRSGALHAYR